MIANSSNWRWIRKELVVLCMAYTGEPLLSSVRSLYPSLIPISTHSMSSESVQIRNLLSVLAERIELSKNMYLSGQVNLSLSSCLSISLAVSLSVCLSLCLSACLCLYLSLSVCLSLTHKYSHTILWFIIFSIHFVINILND